MLSLTLTLHIAAGVIGLLAGFIALFAKKAATLHKESGHVFFVAMMVMGISGGVIAVIKSITVSAIVGGLVCYMVTTSRVAVTRRAGTIGLFEKLAFAAAGAAAVSCFTLGVQAVGQKTGFPAPAYFLFGTIAGLCAVSDLRMLYRGGLRGTERIVRHLWRMCLVLFLATASIFLGNQQVFPEVLVATKLLWVPVWAVVFTTFYWLFRVKFGGQAAFLPSRSKRVSSSTSAAA